MATKTQADTRPSLLDLDGKMVREWWVVYHSRQWVRWWGKYLHPEFRHVELTRPVQYGPGISDVMWLQVIPTYEMLDAEISMDPRPPWTRCPNSTVQKVTAIRPFGTLRSWFDFGPPTCVEVVKMALGIRAFWVRTPLQLFKYIQRREGVVVTR